MWRSVAVHSNPQNDLYLVASESGATLVFGTCAPPGMRYQPRCPSPLAIMDSEAGMVTGRGVACGPDA